MGFLDFLFGKKEKEDVDFKQLVTEGATILDVRTEEEYNLKHIDGAIHIPLQVLPQKMDKIKGLPKPIIAYCRSGRRSGVAAKIINNFGVKTYNGGGMEALIVAGNLQSTD